MEEIVEEPQVQETDLNSPQQYPPSQKGGYMGSVRFFKHLILAILALAILIPTTLSILFGVSLVQTKAELVKLQQSSQSPPPAAPGDASPNGSEPGETSQPEDPRPEVPSYQALYPDLYAQPVERNSVDIEKTIYLTFDDGPSERTAELLEVLERYDVKATFFVVNKGTEQAEQWMRDIVAAGHTLGIHTYSHDYNKIYASVEAYLEDFNAMYQVILEATGSAPQVFRFPGGSVNAYNGATYRDIISEMVRRGFVYFDWNRQTGDAVRGDVPAETLVENALDRVDTMRRVFLLAHDNTRFTNVVEALPDIIEGYQKAGFTFAALTPEVKPVIYSYPD